VRRGGGAGEGGEWAGACGSDLRDRGNGRQDRAGPLIAARPTRRPGSRKGPLAARRSTGPPTTPGGLLSPPPPQWGAARRPAQPGKAKACAPSWAPAASRRATRTTAARPVSAPTRRPRGGARRGARGPRRRAGPLTPGAPGEGGASAQRGARGRGRAGGPGRGGPPPPWRRALVQLSPPGRRRQQGRPPRGLAGRHPHFAALPRRCAAPPPPPRHGAPCAVFAQGSPARRAGARGRAWERGCRRAASCSAGAPRSGRTAARTAVASGRRRRRQPRAPSAAARPRHRRRRRRRSGASRAAAAPRPQFRPPADTAPDRNADA
jgi:hypothetical protein